MHLISFSIGTVELYFVLEQVPKSNQGHTGHKLSLFRHLFFTLCVVGRKRDVGER